MFELLSDHSAVPPSTFTPMFNFTSHSHSEGWQKAGPEPQKGFFLPLDLNIIPSANFKGTVTNFLFRELSFSLIQNYEWEKSFFMF